MEFYLTEEDIEILIGRHIIDLYDSMSDTTNSCKEVLEQKKKELIARLTPRQREIFEELQENLEIYETSIIMDAFGYGYNLCFKKMVEDKV